MTMRTANYEEVLSEVVALLERVVKSTEKISEETELINDLGLGSLQVMEFIQEVEDTFDISFPLNDLSKIRTVRAFVLQIQKEIEV